MYLWVDFSFFLRAELKPACVLLLLISKYFFTCPDLLPLQTSFILLFTQRTICALKTFSGIGGQQTYSRRKHYFDHFSVAQVIIVRVFSIFNYLVLFFSALWTFLFFTRKNFLYANVPFHSLWSRERQLPAVTLKQSGDSARKPLLELDLSEASKTNTLMCSFLYFLMIGWVWFARMKTLAWTYSLSY